MEKDITIIWSDSIGSERNRILAEKINYGGQFLFCTPADTLSPNSVEHFLSYANLHSNFGILFGDALVNSTRIYREPFDIFQLAGKNIIEGPIMVNAAVIAETGPNLFDPNLTALAVHELALRLAQRRTHYHIPAVLCSILPANIDPNVFQSEAEYIRKKLFGGG